MLQPFRPTVVRTGASAAFGWGGSLGATRGVRRTGEGRWLKPEEGRRFAHREIALAHGGADERSYGAGHNPGEITSQGAVVI
ncbi:MAG: hypothetical protein P8X82_05730 [Gemmatimonadales bacterium]|jgi:hypothetical protein